MSGVANNGLPVGWGEASIGEITVAGIVQAPPAGKGDFTYIDISSIDNRLKRIVDAKQLKRAEAPSRARQVLEPNDVVVSMTRPNLNAVAFVDNEYEGAIGSTGFHVLRANQVDPKWLFYLVQTTRFVEDMTRLTQGALYPAVRPKDIAQFRVPLPPLGEQRRIVGEVEKQFSRLDVGVAALNRVEANLRRYKAAVLKAACDGSLSAPWRAAHGDVEPADRLLARILRERRRRWEEAELAKLLAKGKPPKDDRWKQRYKEPAAPRTAGLAELPPTWCWATVEQVSEVIQYGTSAKCTAEGDGVPVLRMGNITSDGVIDAAQLKHLPPEHEEFPALLLAPGDLLFNRTNSAELVGKSAVYHGAPTPCSFASYLIRVRCLDGASPVYVAACLNSSLGRSWIKRVVSQQVGQANVNGSKLGAFAFPLPPVLEQEDIVRQLDASLTVAQHTVGVVEANVRRADRLRQAILKAAFEGRLVAQDPSDEPAAALLGRIRAGRDATERQTARRSRPRRRVPHA